MKNKVKLFGAIAVVAISAFSYVQVNRAENLDNFLLENIEALAADENDVDTLCVGYGSVVCPINKVGVAHVRTYYSLPH